MENAMVFKGTSKTVHNKLLSIMLVVRSEKITREVKESDFQLLCYMRPMALLMYFRWLQCLCILKKGNLVKRFWWDISYGWIFRGSARYCQEVLSRCRIRSLLCASSRFILNVTSVSRSDCTFLLVCKEYNFFYLPLRE